MSRPSRILLRFAAALLAVLPTAAAQGEAGEEVEEIAKGIKSRLGVYESPSFIWALAVSAGQARPIINDAEKAFGEVTRVFGLEGFEKMWGRKKALMVVLKNKTQYRRFVRFYAKKNEGPYLWEGFGRYVMRRPFWPQPVPRVCGMMHLKPADLKGLRNTAVHVVGHLSILRFQYHNRPIPPWLEEGFGCWLEARVCGTNNRFCFSGGYGDVAQEMDKFTDIKWRAWKIKVAQQARSRQSKRMDKILPLRLNQLTADDIGKSWSMIDFMISEDPKKFTEFVTLMKSYWPSTHDPQFSPDKEKAQARALKESFGWTWDELDQNWLTYVRTRYR